MLSENGGSRRCDRLVMSFNARMYTDYFFLLIFTTLQYYLSRETTTTARPITFYAAVSRSTLLGTSQAVTPIQEQLFLVRKALTNHYISPEDLATVKAYEVSDAHDVSAPGTEILIAELLLKCVTNSNPIPQQPDKRITYNGFGECQKYGV